MHLYLEFGYYSLLPLGKVGEKKANLLITCPSSNIFYSPEVVVLHFEVTVINGPKKLGGRPF